MVFSFFKKEDKSKKSPSAANVRGPGRSNHAPASTKNTTKTTLRPDAQPSPLGPTFPLTGTQDAVRESARSVAMATAAKIDAIESEMARDFFKPTKSVRTTIQIPDDAISIEAAPPPDTIPAPPDTPISRLGESTRAYNTSTLASTHHPEDDNFDPGTDVLAGSIQAIKVDHHDKLAVLDETAILYANGRDLEAESGLRAALADETLGTATERGWLMLLELLQQRGDQVGFKQLANHYNARFGLPAPQWRDETQSDKPVVEAPLIPMTVLPRVIDASIVKHLESFKALAGSNPVLGLDLRATQSMDLVGAELLLRVIHAFRRATHQLHIQGIDALLAALKHLTIAGQRASSDAAWMLHLEVLRLMNRQHDFEETGIQYCITFEVSPPSWEPPLSNIHLDAGQPNGLKSSPPEEDFPEWRGDITGDGQTYAQALWTAGQTHSRVIIECRHLRRFAFSAGNAVLGILVRLQHAGVEVEFRDVNCLVAALWQLLGISAASDVRVRRN